MTAPLMEGVASAAQLWPPPKDAEPGCKVPKGGEETAGIYFNTRLRNFPEVCSDEGRDNGAEKTQERLPPGQDASRINITPFSLLLASPPQASDRMGRTTREAGGRRSGFNRPDVLGSLVLKTLKQKVKSARRFSLCSE